MIIIYSENRNFLTINVLCFISARKQFQIYNTKTSWKCYFLCTIACLFFSEQLELCARPNYKCYSNYIKVNHCPTNICPYPDLFDKCKCVHCVKIVSVIVIIWYIPPIKGCFLLLRNNNNITPSAYDWKVFCYGFLVYFGVTAINKEFLLLYFFFYFHLIATFKGGTMQT